MQRNSVYSTNIVSIWYDQDRQMLEIEFHGNGVYQYLWVPKNIYEELMSAPSHGLYFAKNIRVKYPLLIR